MNKHFYSFREVAVLFFCSGLLVGMIIGFASCAPAGELEDRHLTSIGVGK